MEPETTWLDEQGAPLPGPDGAVAVEIQEFDDQGVRTGRTYARLDATPHVTLPDGRR